MSYTVLDKKGQAILVTGASILELRQEISKKLRLDVHRVVIKHEGKALSDTVSPCTLDVSKKAPLEFKDLGPQIGYRTVFYLEYLGPMVFVLLYALCPRVTNGAGNVLFTTDLQVRLEELDWVARLGFWCWMGHFAKREFETAFVHKFSRPTMPLSNLFKNCTYYWSFGAIIGYPLLSASFVAPASEVQVYAGLALFLLAELGNLSIHLQLSSMRPAEGSQKREIPTGFGFNLVACPNYTFEVLSWVGFSVMTNLTASWCFTLLGFYQMADWAQKKHRGYKITYETEYTKLNRKAIIPFLY